MFFWKFTRSGKYSSKYISLIMDFHASQIQNGMLLTNFEECKDILYLIHDVETVNGKVNHTSGVEKLPFQTQVNKLGFKASSLYKEKRFELNLVNGNITLGTHNGTPLDFGLSDKAGFPVGLELSKLKISMMIKAETGIIYGDEDKLKAFRNNSLFVNKGYYFDLMPIHECIVEIVEKMKSVDRKATVEFLKNELKWSEI